MARHYRAKLFVQHVVELWRYPAADFAPAKYFDEFYERLLKQAGQQLQNFVNAHPDNESGRECVVQEGTASECILSLADAQKIDLIVMGTHGRRGFDHLMLGSVTERLLRRAPCPVLVVREPCHDFIDPTMPQDPIHLKRILFCTDFSKSSLRGLDYALSLAAEYDAELTLLHVSEPAAGSPTEQETMALLAEMIPPEHRGTDRIKTIVCVGEAYQQIIQFASETQVDLVVMAVRGRGALNLVAFGSTTHRVIRLGPCLVLAVHVRDV